MSLIRKRSQRKVQPLWAVDAADPFAHRFEVFVDDDPPPVTVSTCGSAVLTANCRRASDDDPRCSVCLAVGGVHSAGEEP